MGPPKACRQADDLLFRAGNAEAVDEACRRSEVGKLLPNALYVHKDALDSLEPLLRVYEGCARAYLGEVEGANLIKLHRQSGKVSYLVYPDFDADPHPALLRSIKLSLRTRELDCHDYANSANPPVLHRKETFLPARPPAARRSSPASPPRKRSTACSTTPRPSAPATAGTAASPTAASPSAGTGWCGAGVIARGTRDEAGAYWPDTTIGRIGQARGCPARLTSTGTFPYTTAHTDRTGRWKVAERSLLLYLPSSLW